MRTFDERSERNLATLLPAAQGRFRDFLAALLDAGLEAKIISGHRTWAEQDALYAQGRTTKGQIVTYARGGQSNHNYGVAVDIGLFNGTDYLEESPLYDKAGAIGKKVGLLWGGDWKKPDKPHFEYPTGLTIAQMRQRVIDKLPILPEPPKPAGWSVLSPSGETLAWGLEPGKGGTGLVRAIWTAAGGTLDVDGERKVIRLRKGGA